MTRKLTQEQAVTLAEWLGGKYYTECLETNDTRCPEKNDLPYYRFDSVAGNERHWVLVERFAEWLRSPEGQDALMDRILKGPSWIGVEIYIPPDAELQGQAFSATIRNVDQDEIIRCGKTRQEALIQACLQVAEMEIQK